MTTGSIPSLAVVLTGALWGVYWIPARALDGTAMSGAWSTLVVTVMAGLLLAPVAVVRLRRLPLRAGGGLLAALLGGTAFGVYAVGLLYGKIAVVILLFYLTPVWSTLIERVWFGWPVSPPRYAAIALGLVGMALVLGRSAWLPLPADLGEWLGLAGGLLWSLASTAMLSGRRSGPPETAFMFAVGASLVAAVIALAMAPWPRLPAPDGAGTAAAWALATAAIWWCGSIMLLVWATQRLPPARVGILLMSEVVVGVASAAVLTGEAFGWREAVGGLMVVAAGFIEVWPSRPRLAAAAGD